MNSRTRTKRSYAGACLVLIAALPVIGGGECTRSGPYIGPGDVPPNPEECNLSALMVSTDFSIADLGVCVDNPKERDGCSCESYGGEMPEGVILPLDTNPRGCHHEGDFDGLKYILPACAQIAEVSGRIMEYSPFTASYSDEDTHVSICPDRATMRAAPFIPLTEMELRTQHNFEALPIGSLLMEVQDCRWYDGDITIDANVLDPNLVGTRVFSSRPTPFAPLIPEAAPDMISVAADWIADYNHGEPPEKASMEIHEARAIAIVKPVTDKVAVALTSAFFAAGTAQASEIGLGIKMPPLPEELFDPLFPKKWRLACRVLEDGFVTNPSCTRNTLALIDARDDYLDPIAQKDGRCNLILGNEDKPEWPRGRAVETTA